MEAMTPRRETAGPGSTAPLGRVPSGAVDVAAERARTIGVGHAHHLNAAGSALPPVDVVDAVVEHLRREERDGGYEAAAVVRDRVEASYDAAAAVVGADRDEIALLDSASTGLRVVVDALRLGSRQRILAGRSTYVSHALHLMTVAQDTGAELVVLPEDGSGRVDLARLEELLAAGRGADDLLCIAHVPTSSGLVEPVVEIGALARRYGARYLLDATQSVGMLPVDVDEIGCDALAATGRKFVRGPRGTGFAYVRRSLLDELRPLAPDVRGADWTGVREWRLADTARRFESFECSTAARLGLGAALRALLDRGVEATGRHLVTAAAELRGALAASDGVRILDPTASASAIVTFALDGVAPDRVKERLAEARVKVVTVPASHGQWDLGHRDLPAVVRASVHVYNDDDDLAALVDTIRELAGDCG